jgi:signal transduction histidine kinase
LRAREEEARIGLLESRFDEEFEKSAMSLSVLGHAHDLGPAGRSLKISVKDIKDATRSFQDGVLQQRVREIDQTVDALVRISDRIRHYGSPDQRMSRKVSEVDVVLRDLQDYLRFRVAEVGAGHVDLAMSISAADKNEVYSAQIDPLKLERAVANLVENAAHFCKPMKPRGKVSITVRPASSDRWILIHVEDNGPGIAPSVSPYIFDKFFTTRPQSHGMGLGLYLTRRFISDGGGRVRSLRRSTGTAFEVSLPPSKR